MARRRKFAQSEIEEIETADAEHVEEPRTEKPVENTRLMGGMVEGKWSGIPMWTCPRCRGTTFKASEAKIHVCKVPKMADEADE